VFLPPSLTVTARIQQAGLSEEVTMGFATTSVLLLRLLLLLVLLLSRTSAWSVGGAAAPAVSPAIFSKYQLVAKRKTRKIGGLQASSSHVEEVEPIRAASGHSSVGSSQSQKIQSIDFGLSDDEFEQWLAIELQQGYPNVAELYPKLFQLAPKCITKWRHRYRGDMALWKRVFKKERVIKEFVEAAPIIDELMAWIDRNQDLDKITIVDLACGKGYLSMMLSELLPPEKVEKCVLVDKQWPMCGSMPKAHHINWDHIYGTNPTTKQQYFETWPIPLHTSKQNIQRSCNKRQMKKILFDRAPGPIVVLAVHLCGTLSLHAVDMFNDHSNVEFFALKPCCLPPIKYEKEVFSLGGGQYTFPASEVCAAGKWSGKEWIGPPRWHLKDRFDKWSDHLLHGIVVDKKRDQKHSQEIMVQTSGGYQNTFLFAGRRRTTTGT
jgi:hypothetical protein